jgi:hypothetical protein
MVISCDENKPKLSLDKMKEGIISVVGHDRIPKNI